MIRVAEGATDQEPGEGDGIGYPEALARLRDLMAGVEELIHDTPYIRAPIVDDQGNNVNVHPLRMSLGSMRRVQASLFQSYGQTMWEHVDETNRVVNIELTTDHPMEDG